VVAALVRILVRIDARRPASWVAAGIAVAAALALARAPATAATIAAAVVCGGWAAVAAAGHAPCGIVPGRVACDAAVRWTRALWPLAGSLAAAVWLANGVGAERPVVVAVALGVVIATSCGAAAARRGAAPADAASFAAVASTAAAAAGLPVSGAWPAVAAVGLAAVAIPAMAWAAWRLDVGLPGTTDGEPRSQRPLVAEISLARGGLRRTLAALAMASSLAGLAGWYYLAPEAAAYGCPFAVGWFAALAVPAALIGPPSGSDWQGVAGSAATAGTGAAVISRRPTGLRLAVAAAVGHAALLGWPPLVAGLLRTAEEATVGTVFASAWPWIAVATLAAGALALIALASLAAAVPLNRETALALAAGLVAAATVLAASSLPDLRGPPSAPGQTGVEKMARLTR